jgi:ABC-type polysaccharide/polyol phosphate export permease
MSTRTSTTVPHAEFFPPERTPPVLARWCGAVRDDVHLLRQFWPVVQNMVVQDLRVRYQRSVLGFFWTLLNPILMMAVMTIVFANLLGRGDWRAYAIYLFSGQLPWTLLATSLNDCAFSMIHNESLIRKIYVPKFIFPLNRVLFNLVTFLLSLGALFLLLLPLGARPTWPLVMLPVSIAIFVVFVFGIGLFLSVINTFYRDCGHLIGVVLQAWFFTTPILYEADQYKSQPWFLSLNPAYAFIRQFHRIIRDGMWPGPSTLAVSALLAAISLGIGYATYKSYEDKLVFRL